MLWADCFLIDFQMNIYQTESYFDDCFHLQKMVHHFCGVDSLHSQLEWGKTAYISELLGFSFNLTVINYGDIRWKHCYHAYFMRVKYTSSFSDFNALEYFTSKFQKSGMLSLSHHWTVVKFSGASVGNNVLMQLMNRA